MLPITNAETEIHFLGKYANGTTAAGCEKVNGKDDDLKLWNKT